MAISASAVKELRERTGAGMMDCKKALTENDGDIENAIDWLRKKGLAAAAKKSGRAAAEGLVAIKAEGTKGVIVEVNAETDFVSRNEQFQNYAQSVASVGFECATMEELKQADFPGTNRNVGEELTSLIAVIGENMNLRRFAALEVSQGVVTSYMHSAITAGLGRIGVIVALESNGDHEKLNQLGRQIAMHVAAANPQFIKREEVSQDMLDRERDVLREQALESGKPADVVEKMMEGRLRKYYEENVLLEQIFMVDDTKRKVCDVIADAAKDLGTDVSLAGCIQYRLGEGVEKKVEDFASEVAAQLGK